MTAIVIANIVLDLAIFAVIVGGHAAAILTQRRDRPHIFVRRPRRTQRAWDAPRIVWARPRRQTWPDA